MVGAGLRLAVVAAVLALSSAETEYSTYPMCVGTEMCNFHAYVDLPDDLSYASVEEFKADIETLYEFEKTLNFALEEFGEVDSIKAVDVSPGTVRIMIDFLPRGDGAPDLTVADVLRADMRPVLPPKDKRLIRQNSASTEEEKEENNGMKKAAMHGYDVGAPLPAPYPYPGDTSLIDPYPYPEGGQVDPYPFPDNWASWGDAQSWSDWPQPEHHGGSYGYPEVPSYGHGHDHHDDDHHDDNGRHVIKIIIVVLVILVQIGLIILIAVCIKHYCCPDKTPAEQAPQMLQQPMGARTAVVTPIHIIQGGQMPGQIPGSLAPTPMYVQRALSTPLPPNALELDVPGPASYNAPSTQDLRRATSLTAII